MTHGHAAHAWTEHKAVKHKLATFDYGTVNCDAAFDTSGLLCKSQECAEEKELSGLCKRIGTSSVKLWKVYFARVRNSPLKLQQAIHYWGLC
jgi:hypothetical protein